MKTFQQIRRQVRPRRVAAVKPGQADANRSALQEALGYPVQTKLRLGSPDDAQEHEADAVADRVMAMPDATVQRKCTACAQEDEKQAEAPEAEKEGEEIQRKETGGEVAVSATATAAVAASRGGGQPLAKSERAFFEPRMGADLGGVRVHADDQAARLSGQLAARAFTVGGDVYFGAGEYRPGTNEGRKLIAHELAHVGQQDGTVRRWELGKEVPAPHEDWEVVSDPEQIKRLEEAENIVKGVMNDSNCVNYFKDKCSPLKNKYNLKLAFSAARIYLRPVDDNAYAEMIRGSDDMAFNLRAYRIGSTMMASALLHEMFHACDTSTDSNDERMAEGAVDACRLYTPWIVGVSPTSGLEGSSVEVWGRLFGFEQGPEDKLLIGGQEAKVLKWKFEGSEGNSATIIKAEVPKYARDDTVVVVNNGVKSNAGVFTVLYHTPPPTLIPEPGTPPIEINNAPHR